MDNKKREVSRRGVSATRVEFCKTEEGVRYKLVTGERGYSVIYLPQSKYWIIRQVCYMKNYFNRLYNFLFVKTETLKITWREPYSPIEWKLLDTFEIPVEKSKE